MDIIGTTVSGKYEIKELIGSGGMANVYKAIDISDGKTVAVKMLKEELRTDAEFVRRFEREAQAVLTLSHENIVSSFDVGCDGELHYIVLEYVEGRTIKQIIEQDGPLPARTAVNYAAQVLDALGHAHECGIIHRDVKPQNVIITPNGTAKLADFGIARDTSSTTRTFAGGSIIGSIHYISPEQARGDVATTESDIYSCAIMLYEMVTGKLPFSDDTSVAIALKHISEEIKPPIDINPRLPRSLSDVIVKAASKDPARRYPTADTMRSDLLRSMKEPRGKFARMISENVKKQSAVSMGGIVFAVLLVLGLFIALFFIVKTLRDDTGSSIEYNVPRLLGKTEEDAVALGQLRGFCVEISGRQSSNEYPAGTVMSQSPSAGTKADEGDSITVYISMGNDYASVPDLTGNTYEQADMALYDGGLVIGAVLYGDSDLPDGQIYKQDPLPGTQIFQGDTVDIWISGSTVESLEMPALCSRGLGEAIAICDELAIGRIWVRTMLPDDPATQDGLVVKQSPIAGTQITKGAPVELTLYAVSKGDYMSDVALNLDLKSEKNVIVTVKMSNGAELIQYEATLAAGMQNVSLTAYIPEEGVHEVIVYVGGEENRRVTVNFTLRNASTEAPN